MGIGTGIQILSSKLLSNFFLHVAFIEVCYDCLSARISVRRCVACIFSLIDAFDCLHDLVKKVWISH